MAAEQDRSGSRFRLWIDDACVGSGQCVLIDPELFDFDDDGTTRVLAGKVTGAQLPTASSAVANCPIGAIHMEAAP